MIRSLVYEAGAAKAAADEVSQRGAVIVRRVVPPSLVSRMRQDLVRAMEEDDRRFGDAHPFPGMVHALMLRGRSFIDLLDLNAVRELAHAALGHGALVHAFNSSSLPAGASNYAGRIHVDSPRVIRGYMTNLGLCFPLTDFSRANGAMEIWPGSFELPAAPDERAFLEERVVLDDLCAGDVVVFNSRCWHRSGVNSTSEARLAVTINVCRAFMRQQFDFPSMIPPDIRATLSEPLLQFLGYFVRMPVSFEEFLLPPDERPYRPGQE